MYVCCCVLLWLGLLWWMGGLTKYEVPRYTFNEDFIIFIWTDLPTHIKKHLAPAA